MTNACKYFAGGPPVAGRQFDYTFDTIGNRTQTQSGGDQTGANLRPANYTNNSLNQITGRDVPPFVDVLGASLFTNAVTVNGASAYRKEEYFRQQLPVNNTNSPVWTNITVAATGQPSVTGNVFVAQEPEAFQYDADGNLTNDGRWAYTWDAENRLIGMTVNTTNAGPQYQLKFAYDYQGRRMQKLVATNGVAIYTNKFLYDGWNLVAELNPNDSLIRSYVWGTDLSGTSQGAGGVGGLLEVSYYGTSTTNCFPAYDGNGNVAALINAADGTVAANYEYGAFGEPIRITGAMGRNNPFRFSTKYDDDESDLLYYGYRYYKPSTGTWPNKDPMSDLVFLQAQSKGKTWQVQKHLIEEANLPTYLFLKNDPESKVDFLGLAVTTFQWHPKPCGPHMLDGFIQVGLGGGIYPGTGHPFVDDGTAGIASTSQNCPPLYPASTGDYFEDTPEVLFGAGTIATTWLINGLKFEVCHVCLQRCCGAQSINGKTLEIHGYKIVSIGPCMTYTIPGNGGTEQLDSPGVGTYSDSPSAVFNQTVNGSYPVALTGGCIKCQHPN